MNPDAPYGVQKSFQPVFRSLTTIRKATASAPLKKNLPLKNSAANLGDLRPLSDVRCSKGQG